MKKSKLSLLLSVILCFCFILTALSGCNTPRNSDNDSDLSDNDVVDEGGNDGNNGEDSSHVNDDVIIDFNLNGIAKTEYVQPTAMPYYAEWLDKNYPRQTNVVEKDEGLSEYPVFGTRFNKKSADLKTAVYNESVRLTSSFTSFKDTVKYPDGYALYNMMDQDGNLLLNKGSSPADAVDSGMDLYKHTAANGMYFGNVSDEEPAVVKHIITNGKLYGTIVSGLYAPAGEVVKVEMPASSLRDRNIYISIGQIYGSGVALVIPAGTSKEFVRMPVISNRFCMNKKTSYYDSQTDTYSFYIGSHLGGPIYLLPCNANSKSDTSEFEFTISGAVNYRHYITGVTTREEFEYVSRSSAPYFDMEVSWMQGIRHSGPLKYANMYDYDDLTDAAMLWEKIGLVSYKFPNWCATGGNIVYVYDNYVPAGAAVAVTGNRTVVAPYDWLTNALNYKYFVKNGSWGNVHEFNHHFQKFGLSGHSNEITNNAMNLLEYALFTKISANRTLTGGLSGWNAYTMPQYGLKYLLNENKNNSSKRDSLHVYSTLLHNIGCDAFIAANSSEANVSGYYYSLCSATHLDMTYFFESILNYTEDDIDGGRGRVAEIEGKNYPVFVPVNSVYQVGRIWKKDGVRQYTRTAQPFIYGTGTYMLDFENHLIIPDGFSYEIKDVTQPENGNVTLVDKLHITYTPTNERQSGDFVVTLKVTKDDGAFNVDDVNLVINLQQQTANYMDETFVSASYASPKYTYTYRAKYSQGQTLIDSQNVYSVNDNPKYNSSTLPNYGINNLFDADENNMFWCTGNDMADKAFSNDKPFSITVDLGKTVTANKFTIYYPPISVTNAKYRCTHFKVYVGTSRDNLKLVYNGINETSDATEKVISFSEPLNLRYYKFEVTDATKRPDKQFALRKLEWSYTAADGIVIAPNAKLVTYYVSNIRKETSAIEYTGNWKDKAERCTFGTVKMGSGTDSATFKFNGKQIAVFSYFGAEYGSYEIYIDGIKVSDVNLSDGNGSNVAYLSELLSDGEHTLTIKGKTGTFNLDSLVIF